MVFIWLTRPAVYFNRVIDSLNCPLVPLVLLFFLAIIKFSSIGDKPVLDRLSDDEHKHALDYCQSKNPYYVSPEEGIPWSEEERRDRELLYYHWVPVMLFLRAVYFCIPNLLWNAVKSLSCFTKYITEAVRLRHLPMSDPQRAGVSEALAKNVFQTLIASPNRRRLFGWLLGRRPGFSVAAVYTFVKLLYLVNVAAQFTALKAVIGRAFANWGTEVFHAILNGEQWRNSLVFPQTALCDVPFQRLGGVTRYTLQCDLRNNPFYEWIYVFVWWAFDAVALFTAFNFICCLVIFLAPWTCESSIRDLLKDRRHRALVFGEDEHSRKQIRMFAERGMRLDGVLLFWLIEGQAGAAVARELCGRIFEEYRNQVSCGEILDISKSLTLAWEVKYEQSFRPSSNP